MKKIEIGDKFWCVAPTIESEQYATDLSAAPVFPRKVIVGKIYGDRIEAHSVFGETIDTDSNATVLVKKEDLYESFSQANNEFFSQANKRIQEIQSYLSRYVEEVLLDKKIANDMGSVIQN